MVNRPRVCLWDARSAKYVKNQPDQEGRSVDEGNSRRSGFIERLSRFVTGRKRTSEQDIKDFIEASEEEGLVNEEESEMIR